MRLGAIGCISVQTLWRKRTTWHAVSAAVAKYACREHRAVWPGCSGQPGAVNTAAEEPVVIAGKDQAASVAEQVAQELPGER